MLFKEEIERFYFVINYKYNKFMNDQKEFIDSNFDFISIITKEERNDFLVEYKKQLSQIQRLNVRMED